MDLEITEEIIHAKTKDEIRDNVILRQKITEFTQINATKSYVNRIYNNTLNNTHLMVYIRRDGKVFSSVAINPMCKEIGMVVAVMTHPDY